MSAAIPTRWGLPALLAVVGFVAGVAVTLGTTEQRTDCPDHLADTAAVCVLR